jgi:hypothetical protein
MANEQLVVSLEARIRDFEKQMARASGTATKQFRAIEQRAETMTGRLKGMGTGAFGGLTKGAIGVLAPLLSATAAINGAKAAVNEFGNIADRSAAAGVDPEFFQAFAHNAKLAGIETEATAGALATFAKNSGQLSAEYGRLLSTLRQMNPEAARQIEAATTQEQRIRAIADAIAAETDASRQATIAAAAFGDQGTKLVAILKQGGAAVADFVAKAKEIGVVVDRSLIERADEFGDKLDTASQIISVKLNSALVGLAPLMVDAAGWAAEFARLLSVAYDQVKGIEDRQFLRPLQNSLAETYNAMQPVKDRIAEIEAELAGGGANGMVLKLDLADAKAKLSDMEDQALRLLGRIQTLQGFKPPAASGGAAPVDPMPGMLGRGGPGRIIPPEPFYDVTKAAADTSVEIHRVTASLEPLADGIEQFADVAKSATRGFIDDLVAGRSAAEALVNVLGQLGSQLIDLGLGAIFGTGTGKGERALLGFASGTANTGGVRGQARGIVHGQEAVIPLPSGSKIPVDIRMPTAMRSSGGGGPSITYAPVIDARGADSAAVAKLAQTMAQDRKEFDQMVWRAVRRGKQTLHIK